MPVHYQTVGELRSLQPGDTLGRYELVFPLASGGMGEVWEARFRTAHGFAKTVALKTVRSAVEDAKNRTRFLDEARLAAAIDSPFVASIFDFGEHEGTLFLVMERLEGVSLSRAIAYNSKLGGAALPPALALRIFADAAVGLHAAHEVRDEGGTPVELVHRDVAPANLLLTASGVTKVIDFGVAKARGRASPQTREGVLLGRLRYMAPEQARGNQKVDRRADIWSLGVVLYEMVTGQRPFEDDGEEAAFRALLSGKPLRPVPGFVPLPVRTVIEQCMRLQPSMRYATAQEAHDAAETGLRQLGAPMGHGDVARFLAPALAEARQEEQVARATAEAELHARRAVAALVQGPPAGPAPQPDAGEASGQEPATLELAAARVAAPRSAAPKAAMAKAEAAEVDGTASLVAIEGSSRGNAPPRARRTSWALAGLASVLLIAAATVGARLLRGGEAAARAAEPAAVVAPAPSAPLPDATPASEHAQASEAEPPGEPPPAVEAVRAEPTPEESPAAAPARPARPRRGRTRAQQGTTGVDVLGNPYR